MEGRTLGITEGATEGINGLDRNLIIQCFSYNTIIFNSTKFHEVTSKYFYVGKKQKTEKILHIFLSQNEYFSKIFSKSAELGSNL